MRKTLILVLLCIGLATSDLSPYKPRGWRPNGERFNPNNNRLLARYGPPPGLPIYGPPDTTTPTPVFTSTAPTTTTTIKTTATPRSREPTTPANVPEEDFDTGNPTLAIANSFAFNRPVYVYNSFPFLPGQVLVR